MDRGSNLTFTVTFCDGTAWPVIWNYDHMVADEKLVLTNPYEIPPEKREPGFKMRVIKIDINRLRDLMDGKPILDLFVNIQENPDKLTIAVPYAHVVTPDSLILAKITLDKSMIPQAPQTILISKQQILNVLSVLKRVEAIAH